MKSKLSGVLILAVALVLASDAASAAAIRFQSYTAVSPAQGTDMHMILRSTGPGTWANYLVSTTDESAYALANAFGTNQQIVYNSSGHLITGSASVIKGLLGLAPVASSGLSSALTNDAGFITAAGAPLQSVNGLTGTPVLTTTQVSEGSNLYFTNARADGRIASAIGGSVQAHSTDLDAAAALSSTGYLKRTGSAAWSTVAAIPYSDISGPPTIPTQTSQITNNSGFITTSGAPVQSVAGRTGSIVLSSADIGGYVAPANADWNAVSGIAQILNKPTAVSAFANDAGYITFASVPVLSVNGHTGTVALTASDFSVGNGITNAGGILNTTQPADRAVSGTTDTILSTDNRRYVVYNNASPTAVTVPSAATAGFTQGFSFTISVPYGSGPVTLTSSGSTFNGNASLVLTAGNAYIRSDGTNWLADIPFAYGSTGSIQYNSQGFLAGVTLTGLLKANGSTAPTAAVAGTDYAAATSGSSVLKGNGAGGFSNSKMSITEPATSSTLAVADGKTLTASNTITLSGTDGSTLAIGPGGTLGPAAYLANFTGGLVFRIGCAPGATVPATGSYGFRTMPYSGTFTTWYIAGDTSGSAVVDIKRSGTSIVGSGNKPTLSGAQFGNAAPSGWTSTSFTAGDQIEIVLSSVSTLECVTGVIQTNRTN